VNAKAQIDSKDGRLKITIEGADPDVVARNALRVAERFDVEMVRSTEPLQFHPKIEMQEWYLSDFGPAKIRRFVEVTFGEEKRMVPVRRGEVSEGKTVPAIDRVIAKLWREGVDAI